MRAHLDHELQVTRQMLGDVLLLFVGLHSLIIAIVGEVSGAYLLSIVIYPLKKLHVELKLAICHLFDLYPLVYLQLCKNIV